METDLGTRTGARDRRRAAAWKAGSLEPPLLVAGLGLLVHEQSAFRAALLALDGRTHVPVRFGEVAAAQIVVVAASALRDLRFNAALRGRLVIVYRHESDPPARSDDIVISAPVRSAQLGEALNAAFDRLGAAIRSEMSRPAPVGDAAASAPVQSGTLAHALQRIFAQPHHHDAQVRVVGFGSMSVLTHRGRYLADFEPSRMRDAMRCRRYILSGNCDAARALRDSELRPLQELRWLAALEGHDPAKPRLPAKFRLLRWPDFSLLPHDHEHVTLAALLSGQTLDLDSACRLCDADRGVVAAFLEACQALGHLVAADSASVQPSATAVPGSRRPGFMERLLGPFAS